MITGISKNYLPLRSHHTLFNIKVLSCSKTGKDHNSSLNFAIGEYFLFGAIFSAKYHIFYFQTLKRRTTDLNYSTYSISYHYLSHSDFANQN